jgi:hypothetical protein
MEDGITIGIFIGMLTGITIGMEGFIVGIINKKKK